ncbi:MAG: phenylalanine--tRNA ligase subunit beta [Bacteroidota bacterium]
MKISYNWLKQYINTNLPAETVATMLTDCGLEVEGIEKHETIKGGLKGVVVGEVKTKEKHPDADRLSITTVDVGTSTILNIVCGAPNVEAGQKVIVATIGAILYPTTGEPFEIKKSKIRGAASEGMICAEDEIGLGTSHAGIMILEDEAKIGMPASEYFKIEEDYVFEIGLTPNRADAASHIGVARDLAAIIALRNKDNEQLSQILTLPSVSSFEVETTSSEFEIIVEDHTACPRYSGVMMSNIKVGESPEWLKNKLKAIGLRPINNIVDATNYVLHETGQPLHAFDADKIIGNKIIIKNLANKTKFVSLDGIERELSSEDLMICNAETPMCIAGVYGGAESGVTEHTTRIFLESAYFNSTSIRKSSKRHGLKTDSSFRFERGTDPNITVYALKRVALIIKEISGGEVSSEVVDIYPKKIPHHKVPFSFLKCEQMIGKQIELELIKKIILSLGIEIEHEGHDALLLAVPPFKVDVTREQDVIEEVLRIYGYNNIDIPTSVRSSLSYSEKPDKEKTQHVVAETLTNNGFSEIMCLSLTKGEYTKKSTSMNDERDVTIMNPLSSDLNVMRQTLLFGGLETISYNLNRKNTDLKLYEFGKTYMAIRGEDSAKYIETMNLSLFVTGKKQDENWNSKNEALNFYSLKGFVNAVLNRIGVKDIKPSEVNNDLYSYGLSYNTNKKNIVEFGPISRAILKMMDIKQEIFYANFNWDLILNTVNDSTIQYKEASKFPEVRRDLALLVDKKIKFEQLEQLAYQEEKNILKTVNLFDIYEGEKLPSDKKSYAMSFVLQDETATLTDKQIEKVMDKLLKTFKEKTGAEIR